MIEIKGIVWDCTGLMWLLGIAAAWSGVIFSTGNSKGLFKHPSYLLQVLSRILTVLCAVVVMIVAVPSVYPDELNVGGKMLLYCGAVGIFALLAVVVFLLGWVAAEIVKWIFSLE